MTEEARNPSFYDDGNPRPSGSNEGSGIGRFDVPASAQELEGFELDEGAILDFFADGDQFQLQESYVDDTIHSGEGSSNVRPWRARARRTLQEQVAHPKSIMARSASPSVASNSSASAIKTNPAVSAVHGRAKVAANRHMIKQVMKSFASADELENKIVKTAEERKVWELLRIYGDPLWSAQGGGGTVGFGDSFGAMGISPSLLANIKEEDETGQPKQEDKLSQLQGNYGLEAPPLLDSSPFNTFSDAGDGGDGVEEGDEEEGPEFWNRFDHETRSIPIPPISVVPSSNPSITTTTRGRPKRSDKSSKSTPASTAATNTTASSTKRRNTTRKSKGVTSAGVHKSIRGVDAGRRTEIDDMVARVMSQYNNSLEELTAKADKTQEEKHVRRILGNRDTAKLSRRRKNETITSLQSANESLSLKLYRSQQCIQALTMSNEVRETRMRVLEERVSFVEGFLRGGNASWRVGAGHGMGSAGGAAAATVGDGGELWPSTSGVSDVPADLFSWTDPVPDFSGLSYISPDMTLDGTLTTDSGNKLEGEDG
ncbi:hypothetical protein B9479_007797 [Cryptococcus floricola]|uniref:BZIP domain-containing protein n=1 Tax=Cryptococcus floricola TaxID=2591691 RepID=A0A5D3AJ92_9TREE|nr:hypothetical protein B9479_007797 [Cryptococcus floricola]